MRAAADKVKEKKLVDEIDRRIHQCQKLAARPDPRISQQLHQRAMERRMADAELRAKDVAERQQIKSLIEQEKAAKATYKNSAVEAREAAKVELNRIQHEREAQKSIRQTALRERTLVRNHFATKLSNHLLSYAQREGKSIAASKTLAAAAREAVRGRLGERSCVVPDVMDLHHRDLAFVNPNANKKDAKVFGSVSFAYIFLGKKSPEQSSPWDVAPCVRLDRLLDACCPHYGDVCGKRYSGKALLQETGQIVDAAFMYGVWRYSKAVPLEAYAPGLRSWPCREIWWTQFLKGELVLPDTHAAGSSASSLVVATLPASVAASSSVSSAPKASGKTSGS